MRIQKTNNNTRYILDPGDYYVTNKPVIISTLLGSCIAACLFDPISRIMAMNHFLLSTRKYIKNDSVIVSDSGRYGIHAMELIINGMLKLGARRQNIKAKAFGGGNVLRQTYLKDNIFNIGELNVQFIREFLETEKIPLVSSDLGGFQGRVILFYGQDYSVFVRKIEQTETAKLAQRDKNYWNSVKEKKPTIEQPIELWTDRTS